MLSIHTCTYSLKYNCFIVLVCIWSISWPFLSKSMHLLSFGQSSFYACYVNVFLLFCCLSSSSFQFLTCRLMLSHYLLSQSISFSPSLSRPPASKSTPLDPESLSSFLSVTILSCHDVNQCLHVQTTCILHCACLRGIMLCEAMTRVQLQMLHS